MVAPTGVDLTNKFYDQMMQQGANHQFDEAVAMDDLEEGCFRVHTKRGRSYEAIAVIIASGTHPRSLNVPGDERFRGKGISHCTACGTPILFRRIQPLAGG